MSGQSRRCYHGVPRVIEGSFDREKFMKWIEENKPGVIENHKGAKKNEDGSFVNDEIHCVNYLAEDRINFNFRQVWKRSEEGEIEYSKNKNQEVAQEKEIVINSEDQIKKE